MTIATFMLGFIGTLTGSLALYIHWLTYRRDSERIRLEESRKEQASEPLFVWGGGMSFYASEVKQLNIERQFTNHGGAVTDLEIKVYGDAQASLSPKAHLGQNDTGKITLLIPGATVMPETKFEISYVTRLGKQSKKTFTWPDNSAPKEIRYEFVR